MLNEPEELASKHKIRITAYPDRGGGRHRLGLPRARPSRAAAAAIRLDPGAGSARHVTKVIQECNWLQGLEGGIDTSHAPILHRVLDRRLRAAGHQAGDPFVRGKAPTLEVDVTDYGYLYAGLRPLEGGEVTCAATTSSCRSTRSARPASASGRGFSGAAGHIWVPMDDETTMVYNWEYSTSEPLTDEDRLERRLGNGPLDVDQTTFRSKRNRENNYLLDRRVQRTENFTGIDGINAQDRAVQESMGADRRSHPRAPGPRRPRDDPGAPAAPAGDPDGRGRRHPAGRRADLLHAAPGGGGGAAGHRLADAPRPGAPRPDVLQRA